MANTQNTQDMLAQGYALVDQLKAATYGTPEARQLAKQAQALEKALGLAYREAWQAERAAAEAEGRPASNRDDREPLNVAWKLKQARIQLQTLPLPVPASQLPCYRYQGEALKQLVQGPQDISAYAPGDVVAVHGHGAMRDALVLAVGRSNIQVAFTTPSAVAETAKHRGPKAEPPHTRGTAKLENVYNHRPADRQATTTPAAPAATTAAQPAREEATVATSTKQEGKKGGRQAKPVLSLKDATKVMADNKAAYDAYEQARLALKAEGLSAAETKKLTGIMEKNRAGFSAYWREYNNPNVAEQRRKDRDAKKAKAEADAKAKADAKAAQGGQK